MSESARLELEQASVASHPKETGGILVGVHTHGSRPWIVHAVEIPSKNSGVTHYVLPPRKRHEVVERLRKQHDSRLGYLGEWHSHPLDVSASPTDIASIREIALDARGGCARPVLIVARRVGDGYTLDGMQFDRGSLRALQLIAAGALPPAGESARRRRRSRGLMATVIRR